jgi:hypothetical protein
MKNLIFFVPNMFSHVLNDVTQVPNVFASNPMCSSVKRERKKKKNPFSSQPRNN